MHKKNLPTLFLLLLWLFLPLTTSAQQNLDDNLQEPSLLEPIEIDGTVNCFDYYEFGSINIDFQSGVASAVAGTNITFNGQIINNNDYPVVDGIVYVKIFRLGEGPQEKNTIGPDVVDQFKVAENINLAANSQKPLAFDWEIPSHAVSGEYQAATFFVVSDKFNLLGLSFTDDVLGTRTNFRVTGEQEGIVSFDRNSVRINGENYSFAAAPPRLDNTPVDIKATLVNNFDNPQSVEITWEKYAWDSMSADNLISSQQETIRLDAQEEKELRYVLTDTEHPVYYVIAKASYRDTNSILGIRMVRAETQKPRLNFIGVTSFPLQTKDNTVFACLHGMGTAHYLPNNTLDLSIKDQSGNVIHSYTYEGDVSGLVMGLKDTFNLNKPYDRFTISAELKQNGELVDKVDLEYDCNSIDSTSCISDEQKSIMQGMWLSIIILIFIGLIFGGILIMSKKKKNMTTIAGMLTLGAILTIFQALPADAKSVPWDKTITGNLEYRGARQDMTLWRLGLRNPVITINYQAYITNLTTGTFLNDDDKVNVGDRLLLEFTPLGYRDIHWSGSGYSSDTPWGQWKNNAAPPSNPTGTYNVWDEYYPGGARNVGFTTNTCAGDDRITNSPSGITFRFAGQTHTNSHIYIPLVVNPPQRSLSQLDGLSCDPLDENYRTECTVVSPGPLKPTFNFGETYGKFYYRWSVPGLCFGNNTPMRLMGTGSDYILPVDEKSISFDLEAVDPNQRPNAPDITGPEEGFTNTRYYFNIEGTDPDNDQIRYGVDFDGDGIVQLWLPPNNENGPQYVDSGTSRQFSHVWSKEKDYTFYVITQDINGSVSEPTSWTIKISEKIEEPLPDLVANDLFVPPCVVGEHIHLAAGIQNIGETAAEASKAIFYINDQPLITHNVDPLAIGQSIRVAQSWMAQEKGTHTFRVCADSDNEIEESNADNNCSFTTFTCQEPPEEPAPYCEPGSQTGIVGRSVSFWSRLGDKTRWSTNGTPDEGAGDTFTTIFDSIGEHSVKVTFAGPPYMDVNGDGRITQADAQLVINYINANGPGIAGEGHAGGNTPMQNPENRYDVNGDGYISAIDSLLIINHLNQYSESDIYQECKVSILPPIGDLAYCEPDQAYGSTGEPISFASPLEDLAVWSSNGTPATGEGINYETTFNEPGDYDVTVSINTPYYLDVNGDGRVTAADHEMVTNYINSVGTGAASPGNEGGNTPWQNPENKYDVNGDGFISALDSLLIINFLNAYGEGDLAQQCKATVTAPNDTPASQAFCEPEVQEAIVDQSVSFTSRLGANARWTVPGTSKNGQGGTFTTNFNTPGTHTVSVTRGIPPYLDVNGDGRVTAADHEMVTNYINSVGTGAASPGNEGGNTPWQNPENKYDVNGDGYISAIDVIQIINHIANHGEGDLEQQCRVEVKESDDPPPPIPTDPSSPTDRFRPGPIRETN